jgi:haloalkane dehalogenase
MVSGNRADPAVYSEFNHRLIEIGATTLHLVDEGSGPPVVLVHGSPLSSFSFRHQIAGLSSRFRVIVPDMLGYGLSSKPEDGVAFREQSHMLRRLLDKLELESFRLLVHNWGGPSGMAAVRDRLDQIEQLVLLNTTLRPDFSPPWYWRQFTSITGDLLLVKLNVFSRGLGTMMQAARQPDIRGYYTQALDPLGTRRTMLRLERLEGYQPLMEEVDAALQAVDIQARIVWGTPDAYFSQHEVDYLQSTFPDADLVEIDGGGHFAMEDAPDALTEALLAFFRAY